jgi:hypothetical protein
VKGGETRVKKHSNLYYLFLEDMEARPIDAEANERIKQAIVAFYKEFRALKKAGLETPKKE